MNGLLGLLRTLPGEEQEHLLRVEWCKKNGHLMTILDPQGEPHAYAELYTMSHVPEHPVLPYPRSERGEFLYVWACAVRDNGFRFIKQLKDYARKMFPEVKYICYHRLKRANRLHVEVI